MKAHHLKNDNNNQGTPTSDRNFSNQNDRLKEQGISNGGGQRSDQTSSRDSAHKPERKTRIGHALL